MLIIRIKINHNGAAVFKPVRITLICFQSMKTVMVGLSLQHFGQIGGKAFCSSVHAALLLHVRYWKASLHLSPLSLLQAAFLCHYITYYGFQMSLQSHSGVGDGIGARRGCKVWTLTVTGSAAACDWDAFSGSLPTHCCFYSPVLPASLTLTSWT